MNILEDFYHGNILPHEMMPKETRKYKHALRILSECEEKLRQMLSDDAKQALQELLDAQDDLLLEMNVEHFIRGYRLGVQMMCACMEEPR